MKPNNGVIELNDQLLEDIYQLLKRTRTGSTEEDCARWSILWTVMNTDNSALPLMGNAVMKIDLESRRQNMGRSVTE